MRLRIVPKQPRPGSRTGLWSRRAIPVLLLMAVASAAHAEPAAEDSGVRLAGQMLHALASVNEITEGVARDDFDVVRRAGVDLGQIAKMLEDLELPVMGLKREDDADFDRLLKVQARAAARITDAARKKDAPAVLLGVQELFDEACVTCHRRFRRDFEGRTPPVLLMRDMLRSTTTMNWGLAMEDYAVIAREARQIYTLARVFSHRRIADGLFGIHEPAEQELFRATLTRLMEAANRVEGAAFNRDSALVTRSIRTMVEEGCVSCHRSFRHDD